MNRNKDYVDATTEVRIIKKKKRKAIVVSDEDDLKELASTREFKKVDANTDIVKRYNVSIKEGLSYDQVSERRKEGLVNKVNKNYKKSYLFIIIKNLCTYLNLILFGALAMLIISGCTTLSNYFFMIIISSNIFVGIFQECRAKRMVDKLSLVTKTPSIVIRGGIKTEVDAEDILLDDIVVLKAGQKIVSDAIVKDGVIEVNESLLTGESLPVKKMVGDVLFAGSFVSSGSCICQVERVGSDNYVTRLQEKAKKEKKNNSVILRSLNWIIGADALLVVPFGLFNFFSKWLGWGGVSPMNVQEALMNSASSMIAMIPSGLYLTTSVTLAVSVITLSKRRTLVQDSYSIEMLARTDVLCLDKTGTITDGTMEVEEDLDLSNNAIDGNDIIGDLLDSFEDKNQTAIAILNKYPAKGLYKAIKTLPFSSSRKMSAVEFENIGTYVVGAPEFMLEKGNPELEKFTKYVVQGYRVLLLGKTEKIGNNNIETPITPIKAYIIKDHIRPEAPETLKWFAENDVEVKIISGDNVLTVSEIAHKAGVKNYDKYISLEGMTLDEVAEVATKYTIFGRVAPEQKAALVTALKKAGKTVAMTGDGVNDILALKISDCSIAMASGAEAAQNVSSLVLVDSNFACLPKVVEEGRKVINNITKVACLFLMKTVFAIILTISTKYPFDASNLLLLEIFAIGLPAFFLALQPNKEKIKGGFIKNVLSQSIPGGVTYALLILAFIIMVENGVYGNNVDQVIVKTVCGLFISTMGLITLLYNCIPFTKYRALVFGSMSFICLIVMFVPLPLFSSITGYNIAILNFYHWITYASIVILGVVIFIALRILIGYIFRNRND